MKSLFRLKPYLRPYLWLILASAFLAIPLSALRTGPAALVKYVVDNMLIQRDKGALVLFPAIVIGLYLANFIVRFGHYYLLRIVIARVNQRVKNDLFEHLLGLSADYFTTQSTGTLVSRVGSDPQYLDGGLSTINVLIREPITFLFLFGYALHLNWKLTLVTLLIFPPLAWVFSATGRNLKRYILRMSEENARLFSSIQESFTGVRVVKAFQLENYVSKKFWQRSENFKRLLLKTAVLEEASHPMVELLTAFVIAAMIYFGGNQVLRGSMTSGDLLAFFATFALMMNPLRTLNDVNIKLNQAAAACDRIFEIFDWRSRIQEALNPVRMERFSNRLEFRNVSFAYPDSPERLVLKNVRFTVPRQKVVAIVGASGAGKSSIVSLVARIYDVNTGCITFDGYNIKDVAFGDLRSMIAVVSQDVFLFNDTIEENIRCGRLDATADEIREAARCANALEFVKSLSEGFNTVIGDRGQKLSGGERQRISIARAFLRKAPILILDEATSNLDTASERLVQSALEELMHDRTTLVIAHRLSTIRNADHILVLKNGEILEEGRHDDLVNFGGEYARLHAADS
ncbi:MAG: ABC transporter transmembrane domain-containing protein [Bdellovibrionota bacterium]